MNTLVFSLSLTINFCALVPFSIQQETADNVCSTPRNEVGVCINIRQCPLLYNLIEQGKSNPRAIKYLKDSHCGLEGRLPKVCCPQNKVSQQSGGTAVTQTNRNIATTNRKFPNLPSADAGECGSNKFDSSKKILGGEPSKQGQWPWLVAVGFKPRGRRNPTNPDWSCGGALITKRYVLSAAHCVHERTTEGMQPYITHLGNIDLKNTSALQVEIERSIMNNYNVRNNLNDIALFRLKQEVPLSPNIQPICLPQEDNIITQRFERKSPFVAGWGATYYSRNGGSKVTKLRHVQVPVVPNPTCAKSYGRHGYIIDDNISLCAGDMAGGKDSCGGDSGGPLMLPLKKNRYYVIGVVSYGKNCGEPGYPGVYTRVTNYIQWISDNIKD